MIAIQRAFSASLPHFAVLNSSAVKISTEVEIRLTALLEERKITMHFGGCFFINSFSVPLKARAKQGRRH